jgi:membrane protein required for colicin V production
MLAVQKIAFRSKNTMPIELLDGILIGITLVSAMLAMVRGFSREVLSVGSWVAAAAAAFFLYPYLEPYASQYTSSPELAAIGSAAVIFLVTLSIVSYLTMRVADFIIDSRVGVLDRTLGFVFGAARGILIMVVAVQFLNWLIAVDKQPEWIANAKSKPLLDSLGISLVNALPENADSSILDSIRSDKSGDEV